MPRARLPTAVFAPVALVWVWSLWAATAVAPLPAKMTVKVAAPLVAPPVKPAPAVTLVI